ncbi:unnamed protein product, partial [Aureobasidium pullulans]
PTFQDQASQSQGRYLPKHTQPRLPELRPHDGKESFWHTAKTRISDAEFLKLLSQAYNARSDLVKEWSGQIIVFEGGPPKGYALFRTVDLFVHGHPSGTYFRSVKGFVDHVHAIMTEKLDTCGCVVCVPRFFQAVNDVQKRYKHSYDGLPMNKKTVKSISTGVFVSQKITVHLASMIPHCEKVKESRALLYSLGINATRGVGYRGVRGRQAEIKLLAPARRSGSSKDAPQCLRYLASWICMKYFSRGPNLVALCLRKPRTVEKPLMWTGKEAAFDRSTCQRPSELDQEKEWQLRKPLIGYDRTAGAVAALSSSFLVMLCALFKSLAEDSIHHIINQPTLPLFHYRISATIYPNQINKMSMPVRTFHGPNPLILDVDLSTYNTSDGTGQSPDNQLRQPDARLLEDLTTAFNNEGWGFIIFGKVVKFVGGPPIGYSEWIFYVPHSFISGHIYGHPSGQYFELMGQFITNDKIIGLTVFWLIEH